MEKHTTQCDRCGKPMVIQGKFSPDDTFLCTDCHKAISVPAHPALAGNPEFLKLNGAHAQADLPVWESRDKLWGSDGMFVSAMHSTPNGYRPSVEFIPGPDADAARQTMMDRIKRLMSDPNCVRVVAGVVLMEARKAQTETQPPN